MTKYLDIQNLIFPVLLYLFVSIFPLSTLLDIIRNLFFIAIILVVTIKPIMESFVELKEKRYLSHYFLFFSSTILLLMNFLLVIFHGLVAISFNAFTGVGEVKILDAASNFYHISFYLDLIGFGLMFFYFYFLKPNANKVKYRLTGLISSGMFVFTSIIWRFQSNFIITHDYSFWVSHKLGQTEFLFIALSQISLFLVYLSLYYLNKVSPVTQQKMLDNQLIDGIKISKYAFYLVISFIIMITVLPILYNHLIPPYSLIILTILLLKLLIIPVLMIIFNLNIFQQYNLVF